MQSDQDLVRATLLGDRKAAEVLLMRHLAVLRRDAHDRDWQLPEGMDVDDALQAFFEKVCANDFRALVQWQGLDDPAGPSIAPCFRSILRNLMTDLGRTRQGEPLDDGFEDEVERLLDDGESPEDIASRDQWRAALALCIGTTLDARERKVIALKLADRSHEEVAAALAITVANSRVLLNRAMKRLKGCLAARLRNAGAGAAVWE
jgi:RNA polymerase sigma factor (sigma-70 family)